MVDIFLGAIVFSIWSVVLFYGKTIGLSMLLFAVPLTFYIIKILEKRNDNLNKKAKLLILPITLLASTYFIFENFWFNALNLIVLPILVAIMLLEMYKEKFEMKWVSLWKILKIIVAPLIHIGEAFSNVRISFKENKEDTNPERRQKIKRVFKAILITLPIVFVIIGLLSAADPDFAKIFEGIFSTILDFFISLSLSKVIEIVILIAVAFIYLICFFSYICSWQQVSEKEKEEKKKDNFTIKVVLCALNVIYLIFCYLQIKSLITNHTNINYSSYARQGFFQLMIVTLINLVTLLIAKNREDKEEKKGTRYIQIMSLVMIVFTAIILVSAIVRMNAYENAYGYTVLRLLVYCILYTEAVLLIPTVLYILDKNINLAKTYFVIILTVYIGMNFINFDRVIAKRNVDRFLENGKIDMEYLQNNLGTGCVSQIVRLLDTNTMEKQDAKLFLQNMNNILEKEQTDFRNVNISKIIAKKILKEKVISISQSNTTSSEKIQKYNNSNNYDKNTTGNYYDFENYLANQYSSIDQQSMLIGTNEEFYGVVKNKNGNTIEISYTSYIYDPTLWEIKVSDSDKNRIQVGDWVRGIGKISNVRYELKTIDAQSINVTSRQIYNDKVLKSLYNKTKLWTSVSYKYESEGGGDGSLKCPVYFDDDGQIDGYINVFFDQDTKTYLGRATNPVESNYSIPEHEMVEITFRKPITSLVKIEAKTLEFIAD